MEDESMLKKVVLVIVGIFAFNLLLNIIISAVPLIAGILGVVTIIFIVYKAVELTRRKRQSNHRQSGYPPSMFGRWRS
jgi:uncharacterized protein (DUF2062 family)